ncbi:MAG TPA: O-antigen ligase family protein [Pyrinomonadaceae bacterium]|nr:O-antigen ligase family protein [Pyrinomonadaceae bacterium]
MKTPERETDAGRSETFIGAAGARVALGGLFVYALAAPHSIAGAWIGLSFAVLGWLLSALSHPPPGFFFRQRTPLDLPLWLFFGWTVVSSLLSVEPRTSLAKLANAATFLVFYLARVLLTRRLAVALALLMVASGAAGALWSAGELLLGRGVVVREVGAQSPFRATPLSPGDAIWRIGGERVASVAEIDEAIRRARVGEPLQVSVITGGEHAEWETGVLTEEMRARSNPSGLAGEGRTHSFRASGWTRHYETFAEMLQMLSQLALGFALANLQRGRRGWTRLALPALAFALLAAGIALTAMRTVLVAFACGACVVAVRGARSARARLFVTAGVAFVLAFGAVAVWRTRASGALSLRDDSSHLRREVAEVALARVAERPLFGHGMDAVKHHWREWGFPGDVQIHTHSTPIQLAFDRGLPALILWLWLMTAFWLAAARAERMWRETDAALTHGLALGTTGALTGFLASSLVNYNFGDAEVTLLLWWLMGAIVAISRERTVMGERKEVIGDR